MSAEVATKLLTPSEERAAEGELVGRYDEQALVELGELKYSCDGTFDTREDQETVQRKEAVVRPHEHPEAGTVEECHTGQVQVYESAPSIQLTFKSVRQILARSEIEFSDSANRRTQRIEVDNRQPEPVRGRGTDRLDNSHDDAPIKGDASPGVRGC